MYTLSLENNQVLNECVKTMVYKADIYNYQKNKPYFSRVFYQINIDSKSKT